MTETRRRIDPQTQRGDESTAMSVQSSGLSLRFGERRLGCERRGGWTAKKRIEKSLCELECATVHEGGFGRAKDGTMQDSSLEDLSDARNKSRRGDLRGEGRWEEGWLEE